MARQDAGGLGGTAARLSELDAAYRALGPSRDCDDFIDKACAALGVDLRFPAQELAHIPATGPVIVIANHPFGGIEGLLLAGLLRRVRKDVRVMANFMLQRIPELSELFIGVDPFAGAARRNAAGLRQALRWLEGGGLLLAFPAGEVSHWHLQRRGVTDPLWQEGVARLVHKTRATVAPIYIYGANGTMFQFAGMVHPWLRTALLPRELLNKAKMQIPIRIGKPLPHDEIAHLDAAPLTRFLRLRTYLLGAMTEELPAPRRNSDPRRRRRGPLRRRGRCAGAAAAPRGQRRSGGLYRSCRADPEPAARNRTPARTDLPRGRRRHRHRHRSRRLRRRLSAPFHLGRTAGETGRRLPPGAQRSIIARRGRKGLYTRSLFKMKKRLFEHMGPAIELGRSFVCAEYQRSFTAPAAVERHRHLRLAPPPLPDTVRAGQHQQRLRAASRQLIVDYLETVLLDRDLARW